MGQRHPNAGYSLLCDCQNYGQKSKYCSKSCPIKRGEDITIRSSDVLFTISLKWLIIITVSLPFYALFICLALALNFHYDEVMNNTSTWCPGLRGNRYASISMVVSIYYPERYIWEFAIVLHAAPRIFLGYANKHYFLQYYAYKKRRPAYRFFSRVIPIANCIELFCLVTLSLIGIEDNFAIHCSAFVTFLTAFLTSACSNVILHGFSGIRKLSITGNRAFWIKFGLLATIVVSTVLIIASYPLYAYFCHVWAYPTFTVCEYIAVICIILIHGVAAIEMPDRIFIISAGSLSTRDYSVPPVL